MRRLMLFGLVMILTLVWVIPVQADELSNVTKQKKSVDSKINKISKEKKAVESSIKAKQNQKESLLSQQKKTTSDYQKLQGEVKTLDEVVTALEADLEEAQNNYDQQKQLLKTRVKVMYENSSLTYFQTLLESKSIIDFFERLQLITLISKNDKQLVLSLDEAKKDVDYKKQLTESQKKQVEAKARDKEKALSDLKASRDQLDRDLKKFKMTLEELEKQEDQLIEQSKKLNSEIKKLMSKGKYTGGIMKWPAPSSHVITSYYGWRYHPILKKSKLHTGIDIGASSGSSIIAANKGKVIVAEWRTGYGKTVIIDHGGKIATLYGHCSKILVSVGDTVEAGQVIAKVGSTGWSTGPHLHFEVIKDGETQNPLKYLGK